MKARPWRHLYNRAAWKRLRLAHLRDHPLCVMCYADGKITQAGVADHIKAHKGDEGLFFDAGNLQSLCKTHHDASKKKAEVRGVVEIGCDASGWPLDPDHFWNK